MNFSDFTEKHACILFMGVYALEITFCERATAILIVIRVEKTANKGTSIIDMAVIRKSIFELTIVANLFF